jgi:acyl-CoA synthetase (AMP-forming)/AMP-acid ligase II
MTARLGGEVPGGKPALVMGGGARWTFDQLRQRTDDAAAMLAGHGLGFGDHIAVLFANEPDLFPVVWAAQRTGLYYTPVNWHLTPEEAAYIVADCDARVLVASPVHAGLTEQIRAAVPSVPLVTAGAEPAADVSGATAAGQRSSWSASTRWRRSS